ncbi:Siderophore biosynthesis non-ribosomal peptide synthetase modules Bacillibactin synthetase component F [Rhodococcus sp. B7740]|uniref:non-ribosomal peptide synthetase n=1 Tax=Rhodococcus sp. B7740 TaxID=1564114 RepID=UPI0005D883D6|nr:non-ribosomal peptide synthetase [Rhodococcus sp. B7740]AJW41276.1 Siderophore biosynthesis non-ribosomal peptide synthetase modules Bacillibactin synthetase component F [Rhodococcus sp. B7740]
MNKPRVQDILNLSPLQEGLLFHSLSGDSQSYVVSVRLPLRGLLDEDRLRCAADELHRRHDALRSAFVARKSGGYVQVVTRDAPTRWVAEDLTALGADERERALEAAALADKDFALGSPPLIALRLIRLGEDQHILQITNHHLILDGWSMPLLARELFTLYDKGIEASGLADPPPARGYAQWLAGRDAEAATAAWQQALAEPIEPTLITGTRSSDTASSDTVGTGPVHQHWLELDSRSFAKLRGVVRDRGLTVNTVVSGAWALLLARMTGRGDVVFGSTVSGRPPEVRGMESMVGLFINTIAVRVHLDPTETVSELLCRIQAEQTELMPHHHVKLADLHRIAGVGQLFDTLTVVENYPLESDTAVADGLTLGEVETVESTHYPLTVVAFPSDTLRIRIDVAQSAGLDGALVADRFRRILEVLCEDPEISVAGLDLRSDVERGLWSAWNDTQDTATAQDRPTLAQLFARTAAQNANSVAVQSLSADRSAVDLTYGELDARATELAHTLTELGVGTEDVVALVLPRSADLIVAILAVAAAGAAYLPIDPSYPADRIEFMMSDAVPVAVVSESGIRATGQRGSGGSSSPDGTGSVCGDPADLAYVIYTSGSTGVPKGVAVSSLGLASFTASIVDRFGADSTSRVLQFASPSFDASVLEILLAVGSGGTLVIPPPGPHIGDELAELLVDGGITHTLIPPAVLATVPTDTALPASTTIIVGGDATSTELVSAWAGRVRLINAYGPTEITVAATISDRLAGGEAVPLGRPVRNSAVHILDPMLAPVSQGDVGEVYVGGLGLARGYLRRRATTAGRFVANPFSNDGERLYRTGDLARWDGGLAHYVGRADDQVKIRGHRIEVGEVENAIGALPGVVDAVVLVVREPGRPARLAAVIRTDSGTACEAELKSLLARRVPDYLVPAHIVAVSRYPLTRNGSKVDRQQLSDNLPELLARRTATEPSPPAAVGAVGVEAVICGVFAEVLGVDEVGPDDNFFDLGGDSIVSMQLVSRAKAADVIFGPRDVFNNRTPRSLAALTVARSTTDGSVSATATDTPARFEDAGPFPLTPTMHWFRETGAEVDDFCQAVTIAVPADLDADRLASAVQMVLDRHDSLRLRLTVEQADRGSESLWSLEVRPRGEVQAVDLICRADAGDDLDSVIAREAMAARARLRPAEGVMAQFVVVSDGHRPGRLIVCINHLAVDGVSWRILLDDIAASYRATAASESAPPPPVSTGFRQWAGTLAERAAGATGHFGRWFDVLASAGDQLVPVTAPRPALDPILDTVDTVRTRTVTLPTATTARLLTDVPTLYGTTISENLIAALAVAICATTDSSTPLFDIEAHGRSADDDTDTTDLSETVGWFTAISPAAVSVPKDAAQDWLDSNPEAASPSISAVLKSVKEQLRQLPPPQTFGLLRYLNPQTVLPLARLQRPQIGFNYLGRFTVGEDVSDWSVDSRSGVIGGGIDDSAPLPHVLEVTLVTEDKLDGPHLSASFSWASRVLSATEVDALADAFVAALEAQVAHSRVPGAGGATPSDFPLVTLSQQEVDLVTETVDVRGGGILPLSGLQQGLLFHAAFDTTSDLYSVQLVLELGGTLDPELLRVSAAAMALRYPNLTARFWYEGMSSPVQVYPVGATVPWEFIDLGADTTALEPTLAQIRAHPFDLSMPLLRWTLVRAGSTHRLVLTHHHLLLDGWSAPLLIRDLFRLYGNGGSPESLPVPPAFVDYLRWTTETDSARAAGVWAAELEGLSEPTLLAGPDTAAVSKYPVVSSRVIDIPADTTAVLTERSRRAGVTVNSTVQAIWSLVLSAVTGRSDIVFGATVSGRPHDLDGVEEMVGLFIGTVPLRSAIERERTFESLARALSEQQSRVMEYSHVGLGAIGAAVGIGDLFDTLVVFENYPIDAESTSLPCDLTVESVVGHDATHYPLTLIVQPGENLSIRLDHRVDRIPMDVVDAVERRLTTIVAALSDPADSRAFDTDLGVLTELDSAELERVVAWGTGRPSPVDGPSLGAVFADRVAEDPDAVAVVTDTDVYTRAEIAAAAGELADTLYSNGIRRGDPVLLGMRRGVELLIATVAVVGAGGRYVPLDPRSPDSRLQAIVDDVQARVVIADDSVTGRGIDFRATVVPVPEAHSESVGRPRSVVTVGPNDGAYIMYTSGSTGTPKGVEIGHGDILALVADTIFDSPRFDRVLVHSPHAFDASTFEMWVPLLRGKQIVIAPDAPLPGQTTDVVSDAIVRHRVTAAWLTAGLFRVLVETHPECFTVLEEVWSGGDVVPADTVRAVRALNPALVFTDGYGPTETTTFATRGRIGPEDPIPDVLSIGSPMDNMRLYVLGPDLDRRGVGVAGELYIAGHGVASGYFARPARSAGSFVADPFGPAGARMYRTGDLVAWRESGDLEFVGRADDQVKVRGFRIELGEIESVVAAQSGVEHATVVVREDRPGDKRVVAYVVATCPDAIDHEDLARNAAARLPDYMVPAAFVEIDALPITTNGKVDRRALPVPTYRGAADGRAARTEDEATLCALFGDVLGVEDVSIDDNFFALGGHSLTATRLIGRIRTTVGRAATIRDLFENPTVAQLVEVLGDDVDPASILTPVQRPKHIPTSYGQSRMWFLDRLDGDASPYKIPIGLRIRGPINVGALERAFGDVVARHEVLRTVFEEVDGEPYQVILPAGTGAPVLHTARVSSAGAHHDARAIVAKGFDLALDPPLRTALIECAPEDHLLVVVLHHIAGDGWSMAPLAADLSAAYDARVAGHAPELPPLAVQYADYAVWLRRSMGSETDPASRFSAAASFWRNALAGIPDPLDLPLDRQRSDVIATEESHNAGSITLAVSDTVHAGLVDIAAGSGASLFMVLHSALSALLTRLGSGEDIVIGSPVAGRGEEALSDLVGFFVNTLVLRADTSGNPKFVELVARVRNWDLSAFAYQDMPFEKLVAELNPVRSNSHHPLFQVLLVLQNNTAADLDLHGLSVAIDAVDAHAAQFDLSFDVTERVVDGTPHGLSIRFDYRADLLTDASAHALVQRFVAVLTGVVADPEVRIGAIDLLTADERHYLEVGLNNTARASSVHDVLEQVRTIGRENPDSPAVRDADAVIGYGTLAARVAGLTQRLRAAGIGAGDVVAVCSRRRTSVVVALLAISAVGGVYTPADPGAPVQRLAGQLSDAATALVLTTEEDRLHAAALAGATGGLPILVDTESEIDPQSIAWPQWESERPAYVLFTSGSTGRPKGALVHRGGMINHLLSKVEELHLQPEDVVVANAPLSFDISIWQMLAPLLVGAQVRIVDADIARDPTQLFGVVAAEEVSILEVVPSLLRAALDDWDDGSAVPALPRLRRLVVTGEALPRQLCNRWLDRTGIALVNAYGPTECSDDVTHAVIDRIDSDAMVPIGRPIRNTALYVLDGGLQSTPPGTGGEMYVGGAGVGLGYLGDPRRTATTFVADPFGEPGSRLYRTGDTVRYRPDEQLEFIGRIDHQVKIRGQRIELGEIESALASHEQVGDCVATVPTGPSGQPMLVAHVVAQGAGSIDSGSLRAHLTALLPAAMIPAAFVIMDRLPLTANGKVDRAALPAADPSAERRTTIPPRTAAEASVASIFAELLGTENVGIDDDFFALGGHSLLAVRLINRIRSELGIEMSIREVFDNSTVVALAAALGPATAVRASLTSVVRPAVLPLSYAQRRLWFLARFDARPGAYNVPTILKLTGALDIDALRCALEDVSARHEILRTVFPEIDGEPAQVICTDRTPILDVVDAGPDPLAQVGDAASVPFDLTVDLPMRTTVTVGDADGSGAREYHLAITLHHIATDGGSATTLAADLAEAYTARCAGRAPEWTPLTVQYADFAVWQRAVNGANQGGEDVPDPHMAYWRAALSDLPEELTLPTDRRRRKEPTFEAGSVYFFVSADLHRALTDIATQSDTSLFVVIIAALSALLGRMGGGDDIPIGTVVDGRTDRELEPLVGFFVNTLVLRNDLSGAPTFRELVERARETALSAFSHQDLPFERLVEVLNPARSVARHPLFQTMLAFQNHREIAFELPGVRVEGVPTGTGVAKYDLSVNLAEGPSLSGLAGRIDYACDLFDRESIDAIATRLVQLLTAVASDPDRIVDGVELVTEQERELVLRGFNATGSSMPVRGLVQLFADQVRRTPNAPAVYHLGREIDYRTLDDLSNGFGRLLLADGVGAGDHVAVCLGRSLELFVAVLGIAKAGAAYVPIDASTPLDRVARILEQTDPHTIVTTESESAGYGNARIVDIGSYVSDFTASADHREITDADRAAPLQLHDAAYVIFTSGSTGTPKGVVIEHYSLADYLRFARTSYDGIGGLAVLHSSISFDLSVTAMLTPLVSGGAVLAVDLDCLDEFDVRVLAEQECTFFKATPSHLPLLKTLPPSLSPSRQLLLGGEVLTGAAVADWRAEHPGTALYNMYGPTETTVNCSQFMLAPGDVVPDGPLPIGAPMDNARFYVLDSALGVVPVGVPGEIYIAGPCLARGYLGREALTSSKFVADPFADGTRMYRSGDVGHWNADGTVTFLHRVDDQVKLRGYRIELGEVESALTALPSVATATAVIREDRPGDRRLVAYVVQQDDTADRAGHTDRMSEARMRAAVARVLPEYMVPSAVVNLRSIPLSPNGKVVRDLLPEPTWSSGTQYAAPRTDTERVLVEIFEQILGSDRVGLNGDFFDLGGHSLLAVKLTKAVRERLGMEIGLRALFAAPTPGQLAALFGGSGELGEPGRTDGVDCVLPLRAGGSRPPLFCIHPASGFAWSYSGLLRAVPAEVPIYGLQSSGLDGFGTLPQTLSDVAADYIARMREVQPTGPFHIVGWSFGGLVAQEMAAQLHRTGDEVGLLGLLDAFPKVDSDPDAAAVDSDELWAALLAVAGVQPDDVGSAVGDPEAIAARLNEQDSVLGTMTADRVRALEAVFENNTRLSAQHRPQRYDGPTTVFAAARDHGPSAPERRRWNGALSNIEFVEIDAAHNDMTRPEPIARIGAHLTHLLGGETSHDHQPVR